MQIVFVQQKRSCGHTDDPLWSWKLMHWIILCGREEVSGLLALSEHKFYFFEESIVKPQQCPQTNASSQHAYWAAPLTHFLHRTPETALISVFLMKDFCYNLDTNFECLFYSNSQVILMLCVVNKSKCQV